VEHASALTRPLILAYGGSDRRVPLVHGTRFMEAAKVNNQQIEWIEYPEEGHGWSKLKNNVDFWGRVEIFLNRYIGPAAAK
jgi:dipeptidyl aminopeptidase/acylaminoacyl peptidase